MHPPPHQNFPVSSLSINYWNMYTQPSTDCYIRASEPTAQFSRCTYSRASAPFCLCCSLIDGKMSHSLPLITSPELMSPTLNILPPSLPHFIFHYLSSIPPSLGLVKAPFSSIWSGADPTFGKNVRGSLFKKHHGYSSYRWEDSLPIIRNYCSSAVLWVRFADCFRLLIDCTRCHTRQLKPWSRWNGFQDAALTMISMQKHTCHVRLKRSGASCRGVSSPHKLEIVIWPKWLYGTKMWQQTGSDEIKCRSWHFVGLSLALLKIFLVETGHWGRRV